MKNSNFTKINIISTIRWVMISICIFKQEFDCDIERQKKVVSYHGTIIRTGTCKKIPL